VTEEPRQPSAAAAAAEKVRAIVEAAERSAAELEAAAREDAARIRAEAEREADVRLAGVRQAAARLVERAAELERRVTSVGASLASLVKELEELRGGEVGPEPAAAQAPGQAAGGEAVEPVGAASSGAPSDPAAGGSAGQAAADPPAEAPAADGDPAGGDALAVGEESPAEGAVAPRATTEGARVIALNMALNGTPREQTARYLAENFDLDDPDALLDDVYARAGSRSAGG
jgi:hypothetical protein